MVGFEETMWWAFVVTSSMMEAAMFHQIRPQHNPKIDEHVLLTAMRIVVFFGMFGVTLKAAKLALMFAMMFPLVHDGVYYQMRHYFDKGVYPLGWRSDSTTTDAKFSFVLTDRIVLFVLGLILWIIITIR